MGQWNEKEAMLQKQFAENAAQDAVVRGFDRLEGQAQRLRRYIGLEIVEVANGWTISIHENHSNHELHIAPNFLEAVMIASTLLGRKQH